MPTYQQPGVYIEETPKAGFTIKGPERTVAGFVGPTPGGPIGAASDILQSFFDFADQYGPAPMVAGPEWTFWQAVKGFFLEGGTALVVARTADSGLLACQAALVALGAVREIMIVAAPGAVAAGDDVAVSIMQALIDHATATNRFAILETPAGLDVAAVQPWRARFSGDHAALYYPWIMIAPDGGAPTLQPPAGHVAGMIALHDAGYGIWKAPAAPIHSATGLAVVINAIEQGLLNDAAIDCIRTFPGKGILVFGARTLSADPTYQYVSVRRLVSMIQCALADGLKAVVFEPDAEPLWIRVRQALEDYLNTLWRAGALNGLKPEQAYFVRCDPTTMTQNDLDNGRLVCEFGIAPIRPAEFVTVRVTQMTGDQKS
jgi:phage tail sheath protein FI